MKKKLLIGFGLVLCAVLLVAGSVMGTFAYLTAEKSVTNTFTVGSIAITLTEAKVNEYGQPLDDSNNVVELANAVRQPEGTGNQYKLLPGHTYTKDPTIVVTKGSEQCYVFVKVENGIADLQADGATIADGLNADANWTWVDDDVWVYASIVDARESEQTLVPFTSFTIAVDANVTGSESDEIAITAYAVQADGFTTAAAAWAATFGA